MPTRRIFELVIVTSVLLWPARATVKMWGRRLLTANEEGTFMHGAGEIIAVVL